LLNWLSNKAGSRAFFNPPPPQKKIDFMSSYEILLKARHLLRKDENNLLLHAIHKVVQIGKK
jgi:hypothetical protein